MQSGYFIINKSLVADQPKNQHYTSAGVDFLITQGVLKVVIVKHGLLLIVVATCNLYPIRALCIAAGNRLLRACYLSLFASVPVSYLLKYLSLPSSRFTDSATHGSIEQIGCMATMLCIDCPKELFQQMTTKALLFAVLRRQTTLQ